MTENANRLSRRWFIQGSLLAGAAPQLLLAGAAAAEPAPSAGSAVALPAVPAPNTAPSPTVTLARYGAAFRYEDIPPPVLQRAKDCMTDAVATIIYGAELPWSKMIIVYARQNGPGGRSQILGAGTQPVHPPMAALAQGAMAHAFELDPIAAAIPAPPCSLRGWRSGRTGASADVRCSPRSSLAPKS
jgi:hypothetical protein